MNSWGRLLRAGGSSAFRGLTATILFLCLQFSARGAERSLLWEIGKADDDNREFALAPNQFEKFSQDGVWFVGEADAARNWPYVHPGPNDGWAGNRSHTFVVGFALREAPPAGEIKLKVKLLDAQHSGPPQVEFNLNGHSETRQLAAGPDDESVRGQPAKGKRQELEIVFPSGALKAGENQLTITTRSGSWLLYDWLALETPAGATLAPVQNHTLVTEVSSVRALKERNGQLFHPVKVTLRQVGEGRDVTVRAGGSEPLSVRLTNGVNRLELLVPRVAANTSVRVEVKAGGQMLAEREVLLKTVRPLTVYILPHSHTDIGYTEIQSAIEKKQVQNLVDGIAAAKRTVDYPAGARFVWNVEVLWAADLYLNRLDEPQRKDFFAAVKSGQVVLSGMYLNELTGLCRPEELIRAFRYSAKLAAQTGVTIDAAMISDVPGYTWGTVPAMTHAGIKYFSVAPNFADRIGTIMREWENKPFYWVGPDGQSTVLVWIPFWGYAMSHRYGNLSPKLVDEFCDGLGAKAYFYDIAHLRWSGHGDNAVPDPVICDFVRDWNAKYTWPHFVISGVSEAFHAFEARYSDKLPVVRGDWTPYWEDGAGSSALETALNRHSSDRLAQAETLLAMTQPKTYPAAAFETAWNNVMLYSEHTWGAHCSVWGPDRQETKEQWEVKRSYAVEADKQSRALLAGALAGKNSASRELSNSVDVINTLSWARTELVTLSPELSTAGDRVLDEQGKPVPSQRLGSGELVFLAKNLPPFATKRFSVTRGAPQVEGRASASGATLGNGRLRVRVDEQTGGIVELSAAGLAGSFASTNRDEALNDYLYLIGDNLADLQRNGAVTIRVGEKGPLVASLVIESSAPGCNKLTRELRMIAGLDHVELINTLDKTRLVATNYTAKEGKESVNFGFPFNVPDGEVWLDIPLAAMRPEADQMPSACKNWFTVGRWADVSNLERGITWVTLDAPLVEVGGITATLLNSQTNPEVWRKKVDRTQKLYSWVMNNHWHTNYRAHQEGLTVFRFILRPHGRHDRGEATRFATGFSQPLLAVRSRGEKVSGQPLLEVTPGDVIVSGLKPSDDGKALIVRLFGATDKTQSVNLRWGAVKPKSVTLTDTSEKPGAVVKSAIAVPGNGLVSLRVELAD